MEENLKNKLLLILAVLTVLFFVSSVSSCVRIFSLGKSKEREVLVRMNAEEEKLKLIQENSTLQEKLKKSEQALEEEKAGAQATKKALVQEQLVNQSLKDELEKVNKVKEALEADLKEALASKSTKAKR